MPPKAGKCRKAVQKGRWMQEGKPKSRHIEGPKARHEPSTKEKPKGKTVEAKSRCMRA